LSSGGKSKSSKSNTKKKGKFPVGGVAGAVIAGVFVAIVVLALFIKWRKSKARAGTAPRELDDMGKAEAPLMGVHATSSGPGYHDQDANGRRDWSSEIPNNLQPHGSELPPYNPYVPPSQGNQGSASEYYAVATQDQRNSRGGNAGRWTNV
jgi:hypothetical protein